MHYASGAVLVGILAITIVNIVGRRLGSPLTGALDYTTLGMTLMVFLALSFGEDERVHITVDLLYERCGPPVQYYLRLFGRAVAIVVIGLMVWQLWEYASLQERQGRVLGDNVQLPLQWPVRIAAVGALMLLIANIANFVADLLDIEGYAEVETDELEADAAI